MLELKKELELLVEKKSMMASGLYNEDYAKLAVSCTGKKLNLGSLESLGKIIKAFKMTGIPFGVSVNENQKSKNEAFNNAMARAIRLWTPEDIKGWGYIDETNISISYEKKDNNWLILLPAWSASGKQKYSEAFVNEVRIKFNYKIKKTEVDFDSISETFFNSLRNIKYDNIIEELTMTEKRINEIKEALLMSEIKNSAVKKNVVVSEPKETKKEIVIKKEVAVPKQPQTNAIGRTLLDRALLVIFTEVIATEEEKERLATLELTDFLKEMRKQQLTLEYDSDEFELDFEDVFGAQNLNLIKFLR